MGGLIFISLQHSLSAVLEYGWKYWWLWMKTFICSVSEQGQKIGGEGLFYCSFLEHSSLAAKSLAGCSVFRRLKSMGELDFQSQLCTLDFLQQVIRCCGQACRAAQRFSAVGMSRRL
jgi:hypothetical protein